MIENSESVRLYYNEFSEAPQAESFCPYRVCPLGAHCDHQHGIVTGFAIDRGISFAYSVRENGSFELVSANFPQRVQFNIDSIPALKQNDWADYLRGAARALKKRYPVSAGLRGVLCGSLPIGGLSSSAAVVIAFLAALCRANGISPPKTELVDIAKEAENKYVGVGSGKLDQSCVLLSEKNRLLYLDTLDSSYELISAGSDMPEYKFAVFFSGAERSLVSSKYNMRVDECRSAAYALMAFAGIPYGKFEETFLRDVPEEVFEQYKNRLPDTFRRRAEHWYGETRRVREGVEAWKRADLASFGRLSFESGKSSIELWETGSPELKAMYEIMLRTDGIYGGRFSGAGFNGCCMALVNPSKEEEISRSITEGYLAAFPLLRGKFSVHFCNTADGIVL